MSSPQTIWRIIIGLVWDGSGGTISSGIHLPIRPIQMRDLDLLISGMEPQLSDGEFAFCSVPRENAPDCEAICRFEEQEGVTLIVARAEADRLGLPLSFPCKLITLQVHSSLDAIGFLATITTKLAERGIPVNCVSAYHHDHLFVPVADAERALGILRELQKTALL